MADVNVTGDRFSTFPLRAGKIAQLWQGQQRIFLFTLDRDFEKVKRVIKGEMFRIAAAGEKSIYSNRP